MPVKRTGQLTKKEHFLYLQVPPSVAKMLQSFGLLSILLQIGLSLAVPLRQQTLGSPTVLSASELETLLLAANQRDLIAQLDRIGHNDQLFDNIQHPVPSCSRLPKDYPSGYYFVRNSTGYVNLEYCDLSGNVGDGTGGWMRVAHIDMTDGDQRCPGALVLASGEDTPHRRCVRKPNVRGCSSVVFPSRGHEYSQVCGKIKAYQKSHPSAFRPYVMKRTTIEDNYVDGISLTHGPVTARQHIWTFAAAYSDESMECSCGSQPDYDLVPPFVEHHFFCETASRTGFEEITFEEDPLWDGHGCDHSTTCCGYNNPPWFCKQLEQSTTDDIEMRLCLDQHPDYEDIMIETVDLFIQ